MATMNDMRGFWGDVYLEWKAPARPFKKSGIQLIGTPAVIVILVAIILLIATEWMLIIMLSALVFVYYAFTMVPPEILDYKITGRGIFVGDKLYEWGAMRRYWFSEQWGHRLLMVESQQAMLGTLPIPMGETTINMVEGAINNRVAYEAPMDSSIDKAGKWLEQKLPMNSER